MIMASVGQRDTGPEMAVRRLLHHMDSRYSLHRRDLPGRPGVESVECNEPSLRVLSIDGLPLE